MVASSGFNIVIVGLLLLEMGCQESHILNSDNGRGAEELDGYNQKKNKISDHLNRVSTLNKVFLVNFYNSIIHFLAAILPPILFRYFSFSITHLQKRHFRHLCLKVHKTELCHNQ